MRASLRSTPATLAFASAFLLAFSVSSGATPERVYADASGVIRWTADQSEVALFGANYSLPSACDYRAAGYVGADRKKLVDEDFTHFVRMGWDGVRLCFWGDWENSDAEGNLLINDHLDVLDYAIAVAAKRGISILFTPITTYSSLWPDGQDSPEIRGFSKAFAKDKLGTDPAAIAAQQRYLQALLNHVNPYTGVALKDEPAIIFVEMINEPTHHTSDLAGSVAYINALADAVRGTGCRKLLFHNLSQDFDIAPAIKASTVPGMTFAWYPTGLNVGRTLRENYLRTVDDYPPMARPDLRDAPKLVYEFDSADINSAYMYPAMTRAFRAAGAQFIAMFSYDMLATAPRNLGWQTHFLNLVYSPRKAVSAVIAAEVTRKIPRYSRWGDYPANRSFGPFRVSYEEDLSEMVTATEFLHANATTSAPPAPAELRRIVGVGSSPLIRYDGTGAYFLDRLGPGTWRLELYPDAVEARDPFARRLEDRTPAIRLVHRTRPMSVRLPDLGADFFVRGLNAGNSTSSQAHDAHFEVRPGVYVLSRDANVDQAALPQEIRGLRIDEFVCPPSDGLPAELTPFVRHTYPAGPARFEAELIATAPAQNAVLHWRRGGEASLRDVPMRSSDGYRYAAELDLGDTGAADVDYFYTAAVEGGSVRHPEGDGLLHAQVARPDEPIGLFAADRDAQRLVYTRIGDGIRHGIFKMIPATAQEPAALRLFWPAHLDPHLDDYTASVSIKESIRDRSPKSAAAVHVKLRGSVGELPVTLTLVESDGTCWAATVRASIGWRELDVPLSEFRIARGVMLPLGFPGRWNYWLTPAHGRGGTGDRPRVAAFEHVQISLRPDAAPTTAAAGERWVDVAALSLMPTAP